MIYIVKHITTYSYEDYVSSCHNLATLKPRDYAGQTLLNYHLAISPTPAEVSERLDFFGNYITRFSIQDLHNKLEVISTSRIERNVTTIRDTYFTKACTDITLDQAQKLLKMLSPEVLETKQFVLESPLIRRVSKEISDYANVSFKPNRSVFEASKELMERIFNDFKFTSGFTNIATPLNDVMREKKGVCQDFAQIAIACLRSVGLPAKYMSGYIETLPPEGEEKLVGADASHAWFAVYIPSFGWVDFDPTNNQIPHNQHIVIAWGRDYYDVPPLKGVIYSNGNNTMDVSVDIRPEKVDSTKKTL